MEKVETEPLLCPICLEIPPGNIFQCLNGHSICEKCSSTISNCPQCRVPYGGQKVRNRALEDLIGGMQISCKFEEHGCSVKTRRRELGTHLDSCKYRPMGICKLLQIGDCDFVSSKASEIFRHIVDFHKRFAIKSTSTPVKLGDAFDVMKTSTEERKIFLLPIDDVFYKRQFLHVYDVNTNKQEFSFHAVHFSDTEDCTSQVSMKFTTSTKKVAWSWSGQLIHYKNLEKSMQLPPFKIPIPYMLENLDPTTGVQLEVNITKT